MAMQLNETVGITLKIDGEEARNRLAILEMESRKLERAIKEVPKGSKEWAELNKEIHKNTDEQKKLRDQIGLTGLTVRQLETELKLATKEWKNATTNTEKYVAAAKRMEEVKSRLAEVKKDASGLSAALDEPNKKGLWGKMVSGVNTVKGAFNAFIALAVVQFIYDLGKAIFETTSKFEKYEKVLATALGDPKLARQSMEALKQLAEQTTFSVDELTEGYVKMVNRGLRPSKEEMVKLTDLAASQGKTFDMLVEGVLDAQTGEFERLKEFGIRAKKEGDSVSLSFKGQTQVVKNNEEAILNAITAMGSYTGVQGQNAEMMKTLSGKASNLGDSFTNLTAEIGTYLTPVFIFLLDLCGKGITVIGFLWKAVASVGISIKREWNDWAAFFTAAGNGISSLASAAMEFLSGNFDAASKSWEKSKKIASEYGKQIQLNAKEAGDSLAKIWADNGKTKNAELAGATQGKAYQKELTDAEKKAGEKRLAQKKKDHEAFLAAEEKYDEKVRADREKALELIQQLESEHEATVAATSIAKEEEKINEKRRKRLKEVNDSMADETTKEAARVQINRTADAAIDKSREDFRLKELAKQKEAAIIRIENAQFITEQERKAELSLLDWKELSAKGSASKIAAVKKERLDTELRFLKEHLAQEEAAEKARISADYKDQDQASAAILAVEARYHQESITADKKAAADKKAVDDDLRKQKQDNLKNYSDMFRSLLEGDINAFMAGATQIVAGHKAAWQERISADMASYETGAQAAQSAVNFLNDLAQSKAARAIAEARKESEEKLLILSSEMSVTESLITSSSNYVTALKEAETARLTELQRILTSETTTEEEKRDALKRYYSEQLQQMKAAEESKIQELQRLANLAKTDDEKQAIEAKIALAKQESEEKIRLATEEANTKAEMLDALQEFTVDSSATLLKDATDSSEKQILLASDEAEKKADFKSDLEETIAAENRKARATEIAEKQKAFRAQKKADIATALITGALAVLKALANFFPLNIILAATAAVVTGVQIAKIKNQPEPTFEHGGFIPRGGKHGNIYGAGGIALIDRTSDQEVGEMEGDEAIISADQTAANMPLINEMFKNARTPGMSKKAVAMEKGLTSSFRNGGTLFESPYWSKEMYLFGSKKKKAAAAAAAAEKEAAAAQAEADAAMADMPSADTSAFDGMDGTEPNPSSAESSAAFAASQKQGEAQLKLLQEIIDSVDEGATSQVAALEKLEKVFASTGQSTFVAFLAMSKEIQGLKGTIEAVRNAVMEVVGATRGVENAVNNSNSNGTLYSVLNRLSGLK